MKSTRLPSSAVSTFAIRAGQMFDGIGVYGPTTVGIDGGKITHVDTVGAPPPEGMPLFDLGPDAFLLPGLVDAHMHLAFDASADPVAALVAAHDDELLARMRVSAARALHAGITTVRDLGDRNYLALDLLAEFSGQPGKGPEILAAGPPITTPGGHCHFLGGEAAGAEALLAAVRERFERGCSVVKIMASGGNLTPGSAPHKSQYSLPELRLVVEAAHRWGLPVAAHAHAPSAIRDALAAGADTIEHATFMTEDGVDADPAMLARIAASGSSLGLTLGSAGIGEPLSSRPVVAKRLEAMTSARKKLLELGAKIVPGTDAGIVEDKPHNVLPFALSDLVALGMSPVAALASMTSGAASACGVADRKGRIAVGADADLLAVAGSPLVDIGMIHNVQAVFRAGRCVR